MIDLGHGVVGVFTDVGLVVLPPQDFFGVAGGNYEVTDGQGGFATGSVAIVVSPVNDAPMTCSPTATRRCSCGSPVRAARSSRRRSRSLASRRSSTMMPAAGRGSSTSPAEAPSTAASGGSSTPPEDGPLAQPIYDADTVAWPGGSGTPLEITAFGPRVFWRGDGDGGSEGSPGHFWFTCLPGEGVRQLDFDTNSPEFDVAEAAFDAGLGLSERTLGVRAGEYFWGTVRIEEHEFLMAVDAAGGVDFFHVLNGTDRHLLTNAGASPAYAASLEVEDAAGQMVLAEQLFAWLPTTACPSG